MGIRQIFRRVDEARSASSELMSAPELQEFIKEVPIQYADHPAMRDLGLGGPTSGTPEKVFIAKTSDLHRARAAMRATSGNGSDNGNDKSNNDQFAAASATLSGFVPSEVLPFYLAAIGLIPSAGDSGPKIAVFVVALIVCIVLIWSNSPQRIRRGEGWKPVVLGLMALAGFTATALAQKESPFVDMIPTWEASIAIFALAIIFTAVNKRLALKKAK